MRNNVCFENVEKRKQILIKSNEIWNPFFIAVLNSDNSTLRVQSNDASMEIWFYLNDEMYRIYAHNGSDGIGIVEYFHSRIVKQVELLGWYKK